MKFYDKQTHPARPQSLAHTLRRMNKGPIPSDVQGSYTGMDAQDERPVQDADDL